MADHQEEMETDVVKQKRPYKRLQYTKEELQGALEADRRKTYGSTPVLTTKEEELLENWIIGKARIGFAMHPEEVKDEVQKIMVTEQRTNPFTDNRRGEKWLKLFLKWHPEIQKRNAEIISKGRARLIEENIRHWFKELEEHLNEENCSDILLDVDRIYNADETGVQCCPKTASGKVVPPIVVFPYRRIPRDIAESTPSNFSIGCSDSRWTIAATFYEYVSNCFYPWLMENNVTFPILFLLDGHKFHINIELSDFCRENKIILFSFSPNATCFASL
ncbi:hypothetical protein PR048_002149 [Dryococelus australis]|uniref:HTH CENPB-type domain-containing protein n=1 Tax=Dryococelus australis TaxID=614101 RepID=A0ABQ9IJI3_9NEOP|nr:hypothetical protein PR048_002149 [Dryococelus australis]